jgi:hypothetical protein
MNVTRYAKRDAIRFDQQWRAALCELDTGRTLGALEMRAWHERARLGIQFVHEAETTSGIVHFEENETVPHPSELCGHLEENETVPHPSELCGHLGFDRAWFFGIDFTWAVHAGHEDWDVAELLERPGASSA